MRKILAVLAALFLCVGGAVGDDPKTDPVRELGLDTIVSLGQQMYAQDQLAWKATDVALAEKGEAWLRAEKGHGWIVDAYPDRDVVRFVRDGDQGPQLFYDVTFSRGGGGPVSSLPEQLSLSSLELAQYRARILALATAKKGCGESYNTVVLREPGTANWLVWVMAATTDPDLIILGGHTRLTISADGTRVLRNEPLSKACIQFSRKAMGGPTGNGRIVQRHVVSRTPVETHVFASLSYRMPLYIGTSDGKAWLIDGTALSVVGMDDPDMDGFAARELEALNETCEAFVKRRAPDGTDTLDPARLPVKVIETTEAKDAVFKVASVPPGTTVSAVWCLRSDIVPAPNDYKVLLAGFPLLIGTKSPAGDVRLGSLGATGGRLEFKLSKGEPMTVDEQKRLQRRLDLMQPLFDKGR